MSKVYEETVRAHARATTMEGDVRHWLADRLNWRDEQGDITPRMVGIALMSGAAITVLGIVISKLTIKANTLPLD